MGDLLLEFEILVNDEGAHLHEVVAPIRRGSLVALMKHPDEQQQKTHQHDGRRVHLPEYWKEPDSRRWSSTGHPDRPEHRETRRYEPEPERRRAWDALPNEYEGEDTKAQCRQEDVDQCRQGV